MIGILHAMWSSLLWGEEPFRLAPPRKPGTLRIATFNAALNRSEPDALTRDLRAGDEQIKRVATIIRQVQPDILLINELDYRENVDNAGLFEQLYLRNDAPDLLGSTAWSMPHHFTAAVNTGVPSGLDLDQDGRLNEPEDAWGYGLFPGQYGMAVFSRLPILRDQVRTFQLLKWATMPNARKPRDPATGKPFYPDEIWQKLRLPSKSFWDVPIETPWGPLHVLASHPTPPAFDGPEDRNGCRNHDEIWLIVDYLDGATWLVDDRGDQRPLASDALFVVLGDLNSDPSEGGSRAEAIRRLIQHRRVTDAQPPRSLGAIEAARLQGRANTRHQGDPAEDTADFNDYSVGNLRVDYVLPARQFVIVDSGVVWPASEQIPASQRELVRKILSASDHRLVWVDVTLPDSGSRDR